MGTIAYFVHGRGRGHASRSMPIVARLEDAGHRVLVAAGGDALDLMGDAVDHAVDPVRPGPTAPFHLARRTVADRGWLREVEATAVVTDGDAPSLHAGFSLGLPTVAVGHGLIFAYCKLPPELPLMGRLYESVNAGSSAWLARRRVGVHFYPIEPRDDRTVIARPDLDDALVPTAASEDRFVAYFRDANGGAVLRAAVEAGLRVTVFGPCRNVPEGIDQHPLDRRGFLRALTRGRGLLGSAGSNALAEAVALGKPVLACHRTDDLEQAMNARLIQRAGLGEALDFSADVAPRLARFVTRVRKEQFARFDLRAAMPPVSETVLGTIDVMARIDGRPA